MATAWPWHLLLAVIVLAPLPLGSHRPWAWSLAALLIGLALAGWAAALAQQRLAPFWRPALWPVVGGFVLALLWGGLQQMPAPVALAHPLWPMAAAALDRPLTGSIGIAPSAAGPALLRLATYGGMFWLALQFGRDRRRAYQLVTWVVAAALAYALYGLTNYIAGNERLLWYPRWAYRDDVTGPFVNRNHFATFAGLGLLAAIAMAIRSFRDAWRIADRSLARLPRAIECFIGRPLIYTLVALIIAMAWLQSHSRMGFAATLAGLAALLFVLRAAGIVRNLGLVTAVGLLGLTLLLLSSGAVTLDRLDEIQSQDRLPLFALVGRGIMSAPWTGHGYGSFATAFPMYRDLTLFAPFDYTQAHSSYLELAFELGIPVAAALVLSVLWAALICVRGVLRRNRDRLVPALAVASAVLVGVHATVDFSLQIPAVAGLFAALLGIGVAQSWGGDASAGPAQRPA